MCVWGGVGWGGGAEIKTKALCLWVGVGMGAGLLC